jgi:hypothetical protein
MWRPGIYAEQGIHAQEQAQVAAQFQLPGQQGDRQIQATGDHLAEDPRLTQVNRQTNMVDRTFA